MAAEVEGADDIPRGAGNTGSVSCLRSFKRGKVGARIAVGWSSSGSTLLKSD